MPAASAVITTTAAIPPSFRYEQRECIGVLLLRSALSRCGAGRFVVHSASNGRALRRARENLRRPTRCPSWHHDRASGDRVAGGTIRAEAGTRVALPLPRSLAD